MSSLSNLGLQQSNLYYAQPQLAADPLQSQEPASLLASPSQADLYAPSTLQGVTGSTSSGLTANSGLMDSFLSLMGMMMTVMVGMIEQGQTGAATTTDNLGSTLGSTTDLSGLGTYDPTSALNDSSNSDTLAELSSLSSLDSLGGTNSLTDPLSSMYTSNLTGTADPNSGANYLNELNSLDTVDNNSLLAMVNPTASNAIYQNPNSQLNPANSSSIYSYYNQDDPTLSSTNSSSSSSGGSSDG